MVFYRQIQNLTCIRNDKWRILDKFIYKIIIKNNLPRKISKKFVILSILKKEDLKYLWPIAKYWKIQVSRNNPQICDARFLIYHFKLPSITLLWVITATKSFFQFYFCIVIFLDFFLKRSSHILYISHQA